MNDITINPTGIISNVLPISNKPSYLVVFEERGAKSSIVIKNFIAIDRPDTETAYVKVKGFYVDCTEEHVINNYNELLTTTSRDVIVEMMIPWVRVHKIRSLVFKAK